MSANKKYLLKAETITSPEEKSTEVPAKPRIYTIIVKRKRVVVSQKVYKAYHQEREAERYQKKLIGEFERSLNRFEEDGVNVEYSTMRYDLGIADKLIKKELLDNLQLALQTLTEDEKIIINWLFFGGKTETEIAQKFGVNQSTISRRLTKILLKLKKVIEI